MKKTEQVEVKYIKLSNAFLLAFICLVLGFIGGNVYSVYKAGPDSGFSSISMPNPSAGRPAAVPTDRIAALVKETTADPGNMAAWMELGNLYFDSDQADKAISAYTRYIEINPKNPDVWTDLGVMYREVGQSPKALDCFEEAMRLDPRHEQSRFNKGIVLMHDMKDAAAAVEAWKNLERINPLFTAPNGQTIRDLIARAK